MNNFSQLELCVIAISIVLLILLCGFLLMCGINQCRHPFDVEPELEKTVRGSVQDLYEVSDYFKPEVKPVHFGLYKTRFMVGSIEHIKMALWTEFGWRDPQLPQFDCYYQNREWCGSTAEIAA